eukprot:13391251-Alexandrium_andersonii.AAC.1
MPTTSSSTTSGTRFATPSLPGIGTHLSCHLRATPSAKQCGTIDAALGQCGIVRTSTATHG